MITSFLILLTGTVLVAAYAYRKDAANIARAGHFAWDQGLRIAIRLPFALIAASCLAELIPDRVIAAVLGTESGLLGIIAASLLGGLLPGGPIVSFPLAIMFAREGAGGPQIVALVTGWSVYAFHRVLAYEIPIMGGRFAAVRMLASLLVPVTAAIGAGLVAAALGLSLRIG
jgi:uncharacterized membrane protein YraQ (UPF0718 family)